MTSIYRDSDVSSIDCGSLVVVGIRTANDNLFQELNADADRLADAGISSLRNIGDCRAPATIAHAVYSGHECARNIDAHCVIGLGGGGGHAVPVADHKAP